MTQLTFMVTDEGKLPVGVKETLARLIPEYAGKCMTMGLSLAKKRRSEAQNDYWFAILDKHVVSQFREAGSNWSNYKIHCHLMHELGYEEALMAPNGKIVANRLHSRNFDTRTWEEYMERARAYIAQEYHIYLPLPNEMNEQPQP